MAITNNLGFPRIGRRRELKVAIEEYWKGEIDEETLKARTLRIRQEHWQLQAERGIDLIPSNDFSLYDHVLDTVQLVDAVPARFRSAGLSELDTYFVMARGLSGAQGNAHAMEMTKWFDTNYHYIVPELEVGQSFALASTKPVDEYLTARSLGWETKPVLLGPLSFLLLSKVRRPDGEPASSGEVLDLLSGLLPVYEALLRQLAEAGATWVQMDEPCLVSGRSDEELAAYHRAYERLTVAAPSLHLLVATYFDGLRESLPAVLRLPVSALHFDLVRAPESLEALEALGLPSAFWLSIGVVDGRNVWRSDLRQQLDIVRRAERLVGSDRLIIAPSCSLLHVPIDVEQEDEIDPEIKEWLAFATQKLDEVQTLAQAVNEGEESIATVLAASDAVRTARASSPRIHNPRVQERIEGVQPHDLQRKSPRTERLALQREHLQLPALPTTTIGSFPQTPEVRAARARYRRGEIDRPTYESFLRDEIKKSVEIQEVLGLDVLVHGEPERNDMVEYFAEKLDGFAFTRHGWVQSYGTRCVKPPIIYGDVERRAQMTVAWTEYAASLTERPMKGILTGPVTMMQWSFVRNDQSREVTCLQIALAIRDEVQALEAAGIPIIQIDEAALREGAPIRHEDRAEYFRWAIDSFRLASAGVNDRTQIHTHMCYSDFDDILPEIDRMDADVISIEASRSSMELLGAFSGYAYSGEIGPGIYDIHSPRIPSVEEMEVLIEEALSVFGVERLWVNPDCGLKTRTYSEVVPALEAMVTATTRVRAKVRVGDAEALG